MQRRILKITFLVIVMILLAVLSTCSSMATRADMIFDLNTDGRRLAIRFFYLEGEDRTGDAILVRTPSGATMLIDAGSPEAASQLNRYLERLGITKIDLGVITHPHIDHIGGYDLLLHTISFGKLVMTEVEHTSQTYQSVIRTIEEKNIPVLYLEEGDRFQLDRDTGIEVLNPPQNTPRENPKNLSTADMNNLSLVLKMTYGKRTFLFTGDIYRKAEERLVAQRSDAFECDVIKVPHHGESTSSSASFVQAVNPEFSVITINFIQSVFIYNRYRKSGSKVFLTGMDGSVLLLCDGDDINVITEWERNTDMLD